MNLVLEKIMYYDLLSSRVFLWQTGNIYFLIKSSKPYVSYRTSCTYFFPSSSNYIVYKVYRILNTVLLISGLLSIGFSILPWLCQYWKYIYIYIFQYSNIYIYIYIYIFQYWHSHFPIYIYWKINQREGISVWRLHW